jgi:LacI family transcriptional regulator
VDDDQGETNGSELARVIDAAMKDRGWSNRRLARETAVVPESTIRAVRKGDKTTEQRVRLIARALGIDEDNLVERAKPNLRVMRARRGDLVAVSITPGEDDPFWSYVNQGLRSGLPPSWMVAAFSTGESLEREKAVFRQLRAMHVDALVVAPSGNEWPKNFPSAPVIVVDRQPASPRPVYVDVIVPDNETAVLEATAELLTAGQASRPACLAGPQSISTHRQRFEAFKRALVSKGFDEPEYGVSPLVPFMTGAKGEDARVAMNQLLALPEAERPNAILCVNGRMTVAAFSAIQAHQTRVPDDLRFVGYDDGCWEFGMRCIVPPLSLIKQDPLSLGQAAANQIVRRIEGIPTQPVSLVARYDSRFSSRLLP